MNDAPLVELARRVRATGYRFTTVTPETHARVVAREPHLARDLRDVFGWSLPFGSGTLPDDMLAALEAADLLERADAGWRSAVRFATAGDLFLAHSAYPTTQADAVFFGPDTYRFLALLEREARAVERAADLGCGTGAAGLWLARHHAGEVWLGDVNPEALRLARVNALVNETANVTVVASDLFAALPRELDLVVMNPPYLVDAAHRTYRDGGGSYGIELAMRFVREGLARLARGGRLILYTGTPIVGGRDVLRDALAPILERSELTSRYAEIDPDVFGDELVHPAYRHVERIAAIALVVDQRRAR